MVIKGKNQHSVLCVNRLFIPTHSREVYFRWKTSSALHGLLSSRAILIWVGYCDPEVLCGGWWRWWRWVAVGGGWWRWVAVGLVYIVVEISIVRSQAIFLVYEQPYAFYLTFYMFLGVLLKYTPLLNIT